MLMSQVLCVYFKNGHCEKGKLPYLYIEIIADNTGNKCKFSHDPNVGRKVEKVNLYEDTREDKKKGEISLPSRSKKR